MAFHTWDGIGWNCPRQTEAPRSKERAWEAFLAGPRKAVHSDQIMYNDYLSSWMRAAVEFGFEYRGTVETSAEPEDDPENLEIVAKLKAAFAGDPDARHLTTAMAKLADGAIEPDCGVAILTHKECEAVGKELRRLVRSAREKRDEVQRLRRALDQLRAPEFDDQSARFNRITKILYLPQSPEKATCDCSASRALHEKTCASLKTGGES